MIACFPRVLTIQEGRLAIIIKVLVPAPTQMLRTGVSRGNLQPCATFPRYQKYLYSIEQVLRAKMGAAEIMMIS